MELASGGKMRSLLHRHRRGLSLTQRDWTLIPMANIRAWQMTNTDMIAGTYGRGS